MHYKGKQGDFYIMVCQVACKTFSQANNYPNPCGVILCVAIAHKSVVLDTAFLCR